MGKIQYQNGSYMVAIPPHIIKLLQAKKGDELIFNVTEKNKIQIIKIKKTEG